MKKEELLGRVNEARRAARDRFPAALKLRHRIAVREQLWLREPCQAAQAAVDKPDISFRAHT
jgi:hypothetical protein